MTNRLDNNPNRVSFDPADVSIPELDDVADDRHDGSRAAALREAVAEYTEKYGDGVADGGQTPDDPQLRDGYRAMRRIADPDHGRIPVEEARPAVAQECKIPGSAVKRAVFEPLRERGWVTPRYGVLIVHDTPHGGSV